MIHTHTCLLPFGFCVDDLLAMHPFPLLKARFFDMGLITEAKPAPWTNEDVAPFSSFLEVYAEYVLRRATRFGPSFKELTVGCRTPDINVLRHSVRTSEACALRGLVSRS